MTWPIVGLLLSVATFVRMMELARTAPQDTGPWLALLLLFSGLVAWLAALYFWMELTMQANESAESAESTDVDSPTR